MDIYLAVCYFFICGNDGIEFSERPVLHIKLQNLQGVEY